jgi:hypothetical protein
MIFAAQQHMRFFNFKISKSYFDSLASETEGDRVVSEEGCLVVTCTLSLNLDERAHRQYFMRNMSAMVDFALATM